jgi:4-hydroxy-3-methylbut-2-enyl diphosphate reductase
VAAQTTQPIERVLRWVDLIKARFPNSNVHFADTVCLPTKQRQRAALDLAERCDVVVVVGGAHSNNTRELVRTCGSRGAQVHHVQGPGDLRPEWFERAESVGLTAGTSTPPDIIQAVASALERIASRRPEAVHAPGAA